MTTTTTIYVQNAVSKVVAPYSVCSQVDKALAVEVEGAHFARRHRPGWDGKWHPFDKIRGTFPTGLLQNVREILPLAEVVNERTKPQASPYRDDLLNGITLRDHQKQAILKTLEDGRGILALATAAGKTEVGIAIACLVPGPCVWVVHRKDLLQQTVERIEARTGEKAARAGDGAWDEPRGKFRVVMPQTVSLDVKRFREENKDANVIILDECHRTGGAARWYRVAQSIPAYYRIGLTGTPDTGDAVRDLRLQAATGPILVRVRAKELAEKGYAVPCKIMIHKVAVPDGELPEFRRGDWHAIRRHFIEDHPARNRKIVHLTLDAVGRGQSVLVICDTVRHARKIAERLAGESVRSKLLTGKHAGRTRTEARKDFRTGALEVLIATPIFDEGVDLPELDVIVLAAGGKSAVRLLQRIGRSLRVSPGKTHAMVHDFLDTGNRYTMGHSMARLKACKKEGFEMVEAKIL